MTAEGSTRWELVTVAESVGDFHARDIPEPAAPLVWWNQFIEPALVLGSTQRDPALVDDEACAERGIEVVRRRSGGGAVLLVPGSAVWIDVILPSQHPAWSHDVHRPMVWLGERIVDALGILGVTGALEVHDGPMRTTEWSRLVCFDGVGPGEVLLDGAKLVGISQRRTRTAARLQVCWYRSGHVDAIVPLLAAVPPEATLSPFATLADVEPARFAQALVGVFADA